MEKKTDFKALSVYLGLLQTAYFIWRCHCCDRDWSGISFYHLPQAGTQRHHDQCPDNQ